MSLTDLNAAAVDPDGAWTGDEEDRPVPAAAGWQEREWTDPERELSTSLALFEGDDGRLELMQRRVLVLLLKHRFITAERYPAEWRALLAQPDVIRSRLNDLFLDLHLDAVREVAFKRQVESAGGAKFPTLLYDTAWSREETILMVYLRSRGRAEEAAGSGKTYVDRDDMLEHLATLRPVHATDQSGDGRKAQRAIESLKSAGLLVGASDAERFEVSRAIDAVLPLERLKDLSTWLGGQGAGGEADEGTGGVLPEVVEP